MKSALFLVFILLVAVLLTLFTGIRGATPGDLWHVLFTFDPDDPVHVALASIRLPRLLAGLIAGAALGMAGSIMQALTRNPLADPGLLGVNAGAAFFIVVGTLIIGRADSALVAMLAFPGAAIASVAVFLLGGGMQGNVEPVRLTLAGAALSALLISLASAVVMLRPDALDMYRAWVAGSLTQAGERPLALMGCITVISGGFAVAIAPMLETLSLGTGLARGLGTDPARGQAAGLAAVTLLTGAAVAIAGPIAFLGLMIPPLARFFTGHVLRAELLAAAILGASVLLLADTAGRVVLAPAEVRVGIMTALMGGPVFIWIARRIRLGGMS